MRSKSECKLTSYCNDRNYYNVCPPFKRTNLHDQTTQRSRNNSRYRNNFRWRENFRCHDNF